MTTNEKAAGVLDTPATASEGHCAPILGMRASEYKEYSTLKIEFAALGILLNRSHRAHDGHICYAAIRNGQARYFERLQDLQNHYTAVIAAKFAALEKVRRPSLHEKYSDEDYPD